MEISNAASPLSKIEEWLAEESTLGSPDPNRIILATSQDNIPQSRVVAIREIAEQSIIFFTQRETKKVIALAENPRVSMTLWLPLQQRQVVIDGITEALAPAENLAYWKKMPRERQLRFFAYAPTSSQPIESIVEIESKHERLTQAFMDTAEIPMSDFYCGFKVIPETIYFYTLGINSFSESLRYLYINGIWQTQLLSP